MTTPKSAKVNITLTENVMEVMVYHAKWSKGFTSKMEARRRWRYTAWTKRYIRKLWVYSIPRKDTAIFHRVLYWEHSVKPNRQETPYSMAMSIVHNILGWHFGWVHKIFAGHVAIDCHFVKYAPLLTIFTSTKGLTEGTADSQPTWRSELRNRTVICHWVLFLSLLSKK